MNCRKQRATRHRALMIIIGISAFMTGCMTTRVEEFTNSATGIQSHESVVILEASYHTGNETEDEFVDCVTSRVQRGRHGINVFPDEQFVDALYPWFEPRTAPLHPRDIDRLLRQEPVAAKMIELKTEYMIWIDGSTERTNSSGSVACGIGPGGAGCFGFGTWGDEANYEAIIWDFTDKAEVGRISTSAAGQSYMPAIIIPIPIIAPVKGTACDGIGNQLLEFLSSKY